MPRDPSEYGGETIPDMNPGGPVPTPPAPPPEPGWYKPDPLYPDHIPDSGQTDPSREGGG